MSKFKLTHFAVFSIALSIVYGVLGLLISVQLFGDDYILEDIIAALGMFCLAIGHIFRCHWAFFSTVVLLLIINCLSIFYYFPPFGYDESRIIQGAYVKFILLTTVVILISLYIYYHQNDMTMKIFSKKISDRYKIYSLLPDYKYILDLCRPWKLITFALGMSWLIYCSLNYQISDWDVGISVIMGGLTYLTAPWSVRTILICLRDRPHNWLPLLVVVLGVAWFVVDGVYVAYHSSIGNQMYRRENFFASSPLYFLAGSIWFYRGSLQDFWGDICDLIVQKGKNG